MIKTYDVIPTAANARKMVRIAQIMNLNIDPIINELAELDHYDVDTFRNSLPEKIRDDATPARCEFIKFAHDSNYRCIVGGLTQTETYKNMLLAALASGVKPIIFHVQDDIDRQRSVINFLTGLNLKYQVIDEQFHEITEDIVIVKVKNMRHNFLRVARDGIVLHHGIDVATNKFIPENTMFQIGMEFRRCIIGLTINQMSRANSQYFASSGPFKWWESQNFQDAFNALYPDSTMVKAFNTDHGSTENQLLRMGFILRTPEHFAKIMNIYMDLAKPLPVGN
jgi:hypothetical protein